MTGFLHGGMLGVVHFDLSVTLVTSLRERNKKEIKEKEGWHNKRGWEGKGQRKDRSKEQEDELCCRQDCIFRQIPVMLFGSL